MKGEIAMAPSTESDKTPCCVDCGRPLVKSDIDRSQCFACRSPKGKLADLDIAICASGDNPERIREWNKILYFLQERFGKKRFGDDHSVTALWKRCRGWLQAKHGLDENDYLALTYDQLEVWLADDSSFAGVGAITPTEPADAESPKDAEQSESDIEGAKTTLDEKEECTEESKSTEPSEESVPFKSQLDEEVNQILARMGKKIRACDLNSDVEKRRIVVVDWIKSDGLSASKTRDQWNKKYGQVHRYADYVGGKKNGSSHVLTDRKRGKELLYRKT